MWHNLRTKLLILFLVLLLVPMIGTGLYGHFFLSGTFLQKAIDVEQQNLNSQASHVRAMFTEAQNALIFLAETRALTVLENSPPGTELHQASLQVLQSDLHTFLRTHPMYQQLAFYNAIGERVVGVEAHDEVVRVQDGALPPALSRFVRQALTAREGTLHLAVDEDSGTTRALILAFRTTDGVMLLALWSEWLFQPGANNVISETWSLRLPIQAVLHFTAEGRDMLSPALNAHNDWLREPRGHYTDTGNYVFYQSISVPTLQDRYTIVLFHTIPAPRLQADLSHYYQSFAVLTIGVLLSVLALALFAISRFVEPIRQLRQSVDIIRRTQKTPTLPRELPPDEIGDLSLAFFTMAVELEAKRQSERALVERLITAQEEERKRIAYDLHDGLLQQLVGARLSLSQSQPAPQAEAMFRHGYDTLSSAIVEGRRIMQGLHPSILDDLGLVEALTELVQTTARLGGWALQLELEPLSPEPDRVMSVSLYRIAQEALNNASRHAAAQGVTVRLWQDAGIHLVIADDGRGFNPASPPPSDNGWGLRTMRERVNLLYGTIEIRSQIGTGTTIIIWIPEKPKEEQGETDDGHTT